MIVRLFVELPAIEDLTQVRLKAGTRFLTGTKMIAQQEMKRVGDEICYYLVTDDGGDGKNISYKPIYDKLEE